MHIEKRDGKFLVGANLSHGIVDEGGRRLPVTDLGKPKKVPFLMARPLRGGWVRP